MTKDEKKIVSRLGNTAANADCPSYFFRDKIGFETKLDFQRKIKCAQEEYIIIDDLMINFDQTPLAYIREFEELHHGIRRKTKYYNYWKKKKKQITDTFTITKTGLFLPMQLTYKRRTTCSLLKGVNFNDGFNLTFTENHWNNEEKCIQHKEEIVALHRVKTERTRT